MDWQDIETILEAEIHCDNSGIYGIEQAAHAIAEAEAEKMREGVVWQRNGVAEVSELPPMGRNVSVRIPEPKGYRLWRILELAHDEESPIPDGQLVTVTVSKKEEKDGQ